MGATSARVQGVKPRLRATRCRLTMKRDGRRELSLLGKGRRDKATRAA